MILTPDAEQVWNGMELRAKLRFLNSVWCPLCQKLRGISASHGAVNRGRLHVRGHCLSCGAMIDQVGELIAKR